MSENPPFLICGALNLTESFNSQMKIIEDNVASQWASLLPHCTISNKRNVYTSVNAFVSFIINPVTYSLDSEWMCNYIVSYRSYPVCICNNKSFVPFVSRVNRTIMYVAVRLECLTMNFDQSESIFWLLRDRLAEIRFLEQIRSYKGRDWPASHPGAPRSLYSPNRVILSHFNNRILDFLLNKYV